MFLRAMSAESIRCHPVGFLSSISLCGLRECICLIVEHLNSYWFLFGGGGVIIIKTSVILVPASVCGCVTSFSFGEYSGVELVSHPTITYLT